MTSINTSIPAGDGLIHIRLLPPHNLTLSSLNFKYPLKLISPSQSQFAKCLTVFILSYGGGLVSGDAVNLKVLLEEKTKLCLQTQGSTKIFKHNTGQQPTCQRMIIKLHSNAGLLLLPDPVQPFADSAYKQHQIFELEDVATTSLVILDWVTEGRAARDEHWHLKRFESRNEIYDTSTIIHTGKSSSGKVSHPNKLLLRDSMILEGGFENSETMTLLNRQDLQTIFATVIIRGPMFVKLVEYINQRYKSEPRIGAKKWDTDDDTRSTTRMDLDAKAAGVMWTVSSIRGFLLVKVSGVDMEGVKRFIKGLLSEVTSEGGGGANNCCITSEFGTGCFRCLE